MERMSIQELAVVLTVKNGLKKKEAEQFVTMVFDVVKDHLMSERLVKIKGLGTFKVVGVEPRESVDVNTGERVLIEGHEKITFTPDTAMKDLVNKPFSQFDTVILNDDVNFDDAENKSLLAELVEEDVEDAPSSFVSTGVEEVEAEPEPEPVEIKKEEPVAAMPVEQAAEEEKIVAEEEDVEEEAYVASVSEPVEKAKPEESAADEELESESGVGRRVWIGFAAVMCLLSFIAGCQFGVFNSHSKLKVADTLRVLVKVSVDTTDTVSSVKGDSIKEKVSAVKVDSVKTKVSPDSAVSKPVVQPATVQVKEKAETKPAEAVVSGDPDVDHQKYAQMSARVRTGAYRIVGTAKEVKAKEGETVRRIANRILGPEMECYVEVYNDIKADVPLTAGQVIKIPQLQLKKKKTQQTINQE